MISVPLIDELRETRRRLADECSGDVQRYAEMLRQVSERIPGQYIRTPLTHAQRIEPPRHTHPQLAETP